MKLDIIICVYNEEKSIGDLIENLMFQRVPPEITSREIIVVASGCTDGTVNVVKGLMSKYEGLRLIEEGERRGKASALNKAFSASNGDFVVLVPGDVYPADEALYNLLLPFKDRRVSAVSGRPMQDPRKAPNGFIGYLANMTYRLWSRLMLKLNDMGLASHCSGEFMAIRRDVKTYIPEECAADDAYIAISAKKHGLIKFAPKAVCFNLMPSNIRDYVNQRRRWLYGHFQTKKYTGEYPKVMDTIIFSKPTLALKVITEEIFEKPKNLLYLLGAMLVEAAIYTLSLIDQFLGRQYGVWPVIKSTKYGNS
ncbi:MAG: glycosyltransferase family 2 protein [Candidatus Bathyarchaeia archaeon]